MKYLKQMRVKHYIKNILIFFPLIFSKNLFNNDLLYKTIIGFIVFSLLASVVYTINDINDIKCDRLDSKKKSRPITNGSISIKKAIIMIGILLMIIIILLFTNNILFTSSSIILLIYLIINIYYSLGGKNIPIIDITLLSLGYVLRVFYGGLLISVPISNWLFLTTLSSSYYLVLGKRKKESLRKNKRTVLKYYPKDFYDKYLTIFLSMIIIFYSLWIITSINSQIFIYSTILIIIIFMKYSIDLEIDNDGDPTSIFLKDKSLIILSIIYMIFCIITIYH